MTDGCLLNLALELTTEWGENFGKPIGDRILLEYPDLSPAEIAELTKHSREVERYIYDLAGQELDGKISEQEIIPAARRKYPWLDDRNAAGLKSIGMFYARR